MKSLLSLISLSLLGGSLFLAALVVMVTATVWQCDEAGVWTILTLPLPFGLFGVVGLLFAGVGLRDLSK